MKKLLSLLFLSMCISLLHAQDNRLWATYYGGDKDDSGGMSTMGIVTDAQGNVYIMFNTDSSANLAYNGFQSTIGNENDVVIVKFDSLGNRLWATYYGGEMYDFGGGIALDNEGNLYLCGLTHSHTDIASGGFQNNITVSTSGYTYSEAFLVKFNSDGNRLWATYYGGAYNEYSWSVATDLSGNVYLSGLTESSTNISSSGFQNGFSGMVDVFLAKFDSDGNRLWATYYGGDASDISACVATDLEGNVYLSGLTTSATGIAYNGFQNATVDSVDAFLVKFDSNGNRLWATYYGGESVEGDAAVTTDNAGNVYLAGKTMSTIGIASNGYQNNYGGVLDAFIVKFNGEGERIWATYYGGEDREDVWQRCIAVDDNYNIYMGGQTKSLTGIASEGFQNDFTWQEAAFVAAFDSSGQRLCATYYGQYLTFASQIALDRFGHIYLVGQTVDTIGIAYNGFQNAYAGGNYDAYLVKFTTCVDSVINDTSVISNFITPNGDNLNDFFTIPSSYNENSLTIYNRWGNVVFEKSNYQSDWNADKHSAGIYFYVLTLPDREPKKGILTVIK